MQNSKEAVYNRFFFNCGQGKNMVACLENKG